MTNEEAIKVLLDEWKCIDRNDGINCDRKCESCDLVMDSFVLRDAYNTAIKALEYDDAKYHAEHGEVIVDKAVWEDAKRALSGDYAVGVDSTGRFVKASEVFCDRNICLRNEYSNIGCDECEVTKSQEPSGDAVSRQAVHETIEKWAGSMAVLVALPTREVRPLLDSIHKLPSVNPQNPKWDRLYSWLNDMRFGIAPDETVTDIDERNVRTAQVDLLDEIMEWMVEPQERSEE